MGIMSTFKFLILKGVNRFDVLFVGTFDRGVIMFCQNKIMLTEKPSSDSVNHSVWDTAGPPQFFQRDGPTRQHQLDGQGLGLQSSPCEPNK